MSREISYWNTDRPRQAFQLALLGATDVQIAGVVGCHPMTIELWKRTHPDFLKALVAGKLEADGRVAEAFFKRAVGFTAVEKQTVFYKGQPIEYESEKYYPPDPWAAAKWLGIRQRALWADVQKIETTQTNINITKIDLTGFSEDELKLMRKAGLKQLVENIGNS